MSWPEIGKVVRFEDHPTTFGDGYALHRVVLDASDRGQQLVTPHSDLRSHMLERHVASMTSKRIEPRMRVCVVAVEEGSVDVEEDRPNPRHGSPSSRARCSARA